jgi:membrane protein implicated in regulation of membrane protease activity
VVDTVMALTGKLLGIDDPAGLVVLLLVVGFVFMAKDWRYAIAAFAILVVVMFVANMVWRLSENTLKKPSRTKQLYAPG